MATTDLSPGDEVAVAPPFERITTGEVLTSEPRITVVDHVSDRLLEPHPDDVITIS